MQRINVTCKSLILFKQVQLLSMLAHILARLISALFTLLIIYKKYKEKRLYIEQISWIEMHDRQVNIPKCKAHNYT